MAVAARSSQQRSLTFRDLWHAPDDGNRWEIINGEVYGSPPPEIIHQSVVRNLAVILHLHVSEHGLGIIWFSPVGVVLEKPSGVQPDITFVSKARMSIVQDKGVFGAPDLVVEVLSPSTSARDRGIKKDAYERSGVQHYWILHPKKHTLTAFVLERGQYVAEAELAAAQTFRPSLFPGLAIPLAKIWRR